MTSQHDYRITASVDGKPVGEFDARSGGGSTGEVTVRNTSKGRRLWPGRSTPEDITITRARVKNDHELVRWLAPRAGSGVMVITEQPLDVNGNAWGRATVYRGRLSGVNGGDVDHNSDDPQDLELTMVVERKN